MRADFDFDRIGKREPYKVPDRFFQSMEERIIKKALPTHRQKRLSWRSLLAGTAAAGVAAALFTVGIPTSRQTQSYNMEDVELSFAQLSETDQNYLIETYQDDIFLNL